MTVLNKAAGDLAASYFDELVTRVLQIAGTEVSVVIHCLNVDLLAQAQMSCMQSFWGARQTA